MARKKTLKSTEALLKSMGLSSTVTATVREYIAEHSIAQKLMICRAKAGVTRKSLAQKMGVAERTISRIESTPDDNFKVGTIKAYAKALGLQPTIHITLGV